MKRPTTLTPEDLEPYLIADKRVAVRLLSATGCYFGFVGSIELIPPGPDQREDSGKLMLSILPWIQFECLGAYVPNHPANFFSNAGDRIIPKPRPKKGEGKEEKSVEFCLLGPKKIGPHDPSVEGILWVDSTVGFAVFSYRGSDVCEVTRHLESKSNRAV